MWRRTVDCLGVAVGISSRVAELDATLGAVFATYAEAAGPPDLEYELVVAGGPTLLRGGAATRTCGVAVDLVAVLELDLYREVMGRARGLLLHAGAVVGAGGAALVFAGCSGAGKSTLVRALLGCGFAYLSEECVALEPAGRCRGLARALHVDADAVPLPAGFTAGEYPIRREGGAVRITRLFHPPERAIWRGTARAAAVVSIEHAPGAVRALDRLGGGESLARLWPAVFRPDPDALAEAGPALEGVGRYHLCTARPEQAIECALALAAELGVHPG
jgi:hypothetical protein